MAPVFAQLHFRFVNRDLDHPGAELGFLTETGEVLKGFQHRLLCNVFCIGLIPDQ